MSTAEDAPAARFELADPQGQLLGEIADPAMTRRQVALTYGLALRSMDRVDWRRVNTAIINRWSVSALEWVKKFAWKGADVELVIDIDVTVGEEKPDVQ